MLYNLVTRIVDKLKEATVADIARKQRTITSLFPAHPGRVEKVGHMGGVRLVKLGTETWRFKIHSGTQKSTWYDAVVKFSNIIGTLNRLVMDKRLWTKDQSKVDLRLLAGEFRNQSEVKIECNCPCQQYWGFNYILSKGRYDAKYGSVETRSPNKRNPRQYGAICKHLDALFKSLPFYNSTIARWLNDFYGKDIQELEALATKESEKFKKAGKELGKKLEPKEEEKPKPEAKAEEKPVIKEPVKEPEIEKEETKESINESILPEPQKKLYDYAKTAGPDFLNLNKVIKARSFFWVLSDGLVIGSSPHHFAMATSAGTGLTELMKSGIIRGTYFGIMGLEIGINVAPTDKQINSIFDIRSIINKEPIIIDFHGVDDFIAWYFIDDKAGNETLRNIILGKGNVKEFQKSMAEIIKIDKHLVEFKIVEYDIKDIDTTCPSCGHGIKSGIKICPVCHKILDKTTTYLSREWNKVTPKYTPEAELRGLGESTDYSGVKALYKVYHDVERNIDPSPEDVFTALGMMEIYYDEYIQWYHKYAKHKIHAEDAEIYKAYVKRLKEIRSAKAGKDPGEAIVALDTAINQWHCDYPVIAHLIMEIEDSAPGAASREKQMNGWLEDVSMILTKLGRLPENSPYAEPIRK